MRAAPILLVTALALTGCVPTAGGDGTPSTGGGPDLSLPTTETVPLSDPVEDSFTVDVPEGWASVAYATGQFDVHREIVRSISPDGNTILFLGDPKVPNYWNPAAADQTTVDFAEALDFMEIQPYTRAEDYFALWSEVKFGDLPGFDFVSVETDQGAVDAMQDQFAQAGLAGLQVDAVEVRFVYDAAGTEMSGLISGITVDNGIGWSADMNGLVTDRDVADYLPLLIAM